MSKRKPAKRAKQAAKPVLSFKDTSQILEWIRCNIKPVENFREVSRPWTHDELVKATMWWFACDQSSNYSDLRTKDIANLLLEGMQPLKMSDIQVYLDELHAEAAEFPHEVDPAAEQVEASLREHFNQGHDLDSDEEGDDE